MTNFRTIESLALENLKILYQEGIKGCDFSSRFENAEEKKLIQGMILTWQNSSKAIPILDELGKNGIVWGYIILAEFYNNINDSTNADMAISCANSLIMISKENNSFSKYYLLLIRAKNCLIQNLTKEAYKLVREVLRENPKNIIIEFLGKYLLALVYKQQQDLLSFSKTIDETLQMAKIKSMSFILALCQLERSSILEKNAPLAIESLKEAASIFKGLGNTLQESVAKTQLQHITEAKLEQNYYNVAGYLFLSPQMRKLRREIGDMLSAKEPMPSIILGPSGAGKTSIARTIHKLSGRQGHFIDLNCSAITETLIESELFGHEKGSFTGAQASKVGMLERANGGTLFLDELAESSKDFQKKLLKVVEDKSFYPVGSNRLRTVDVLFIAATNKPLDSLFDYLREDLFYRFPCQFFLAGLSERREEILMLAKEFLARYGGDREYILTPKAEKFLLSKEYKGNIRTLENNIRLAIARAMGGESQYIDESMLTDSLYDTVGITNRKDSDKHKIVIEVSEDVGFDNLIKQTTKDVIGYALKLCGGSPKRTREFLKMSERTLRRYIEQYDIKEAR